MIKGKNKYTDLYPDHHQSDLKILTNLSKVIDLGFCLRFIGIFAGLYYSSLFFLGITLPGGYYSPFLDHNLNFIQWITTAVLHLSTLWSPFFGFSSEVQGLNVLKAQGADVTMSWPCVGLSVMSFWIAFISAQKNSLKNKLFWCIGGILAIWLVNSLRITLVLAGLKYNWKNVNHMDNHDLFSIAAYILILLMIVLYDRQFRILKVKTYSTAIK